MNIEANLQELCHVLSEYFPKNLVHDHRAKAEAYIYVILHDC